MPLPIETQTRIQNIKRLTEARLAEIDTNIAVLKSYKDGKITIQQLCVYLANLFGQKSYDLKHVQDFIRESPGILDLFIERIRYCKLCFERKINYCEKALSTDNQNLAQNILDQLHLNLVIDLRSTTTNRKFIKAISELFFKDTGTARDLKSVYQKERATGSNTLYTLEQMTRQIASPAQILLSSLINRTFLDTTLQKYFINNRLPLLLAKIENYNQQIKQTMDDINKQLKDKSLYTNPEITTALDKINMLVIEQKVILLRIDLCTEKLKANGLSVEAELQDLETYDFLTFFELANQVLALQKLNRDVLECKVKILVAIHQHEQQALEQQHPSQQQTTTSSDVNAKREAEVAASNAAAAAAKTARKAETPAPAKRSPAKPAPAKAVSADLVEEDDNEFGLEEDVADFAVAAPTQVNTALNKDDIDLVNKIFTGNWTDLNYTITYAEIARLAGNCNARVIKGAGSRRKFIFPTNDLRIFDPASITEEVPIGEHAYRVHEKHKKGHNNGALCADSILDFKRVLELNGITPSKCILKSEVGKSAPKASP
jgi:hypothetical protein